MNEETLELLEPYARLPCFHPRVASTTQKQAARPLCSWALAAWRHAHAALDASASLRMFADAEADLVKASAEQERAESAERPLQEDEMRQASGGWRDRGPEGTRLWMERRNGPMSGAR